MAKWSMNPQLWVRLRQSRRRYRFRVRQWRQSSTRYGKTGGASSSAVSHATTWTSHHKELSGVHVEASAGANPGSRQQAVMAPNKEFCGARNFSSVTFFVPTGRRRVFSSAAVPAFVFRCCSNDRVGMIRCAPTSGTSGRLSRDGEHCFGAAGAVIDVASG